MAKTMYQDLTLNKKTKGRVSAAGADSSVTTARVINRDGPGGKSSSLGAAVITSVML